MRAGSSTARVLVERRMLSAVDRSRSTFTIVPPSARSRGLEQIKDEVEVIHQIRLAVGEFLREESTPLSQAEREEIVEQVVWEITALARSSPVPGSELSDILVNSHRDISSSERESSRVSAVCNDTT
jgi:hypothetical protein